MSDMLVAARTELIRLNKDKYEIQPFDEEYEEAMARVDAEVAETKIQLTEAEKVVEQMLAYYKVRN